QYRALAGNIAGCFMHLTVIPTIRRAKVRCLGYYLNYKEDGNSLPHFMKNSNIAHKKKNVVVRFFEWIAKGTQKADQQGRGPCKS
ncbi:hypothetical protein, partial [Desulfobacter latus]|uniref:hypothetical protein n=1 Tax=Desulfobacter latus TaxID=2292 RepID=UPI001C498649